MSPSLGRIFAESLGRIFEGLDNPFTMAKMAKFERSYTRGALAAQNRAALTKTGSKHEENNNGSMFLSIRCRDNIDFARLPFF